MRSSLKKEKERHTVFMLATRHRSGLRERGKKQFVTSILCRFFGLLLLSATLRFRAVHGRIFLGPVINWLKLTAGAHVHDSPRSNLSRLSRANFAPKPIRGQCVRLPPAIFRGIDSTDARWSRNIEKQMVAPWKFYTHVACNSDLNSEENRILECTRRQIAYRQIIR